MSEDWSDALDIGAVTDVLSGTAFGRVRGVLGVTRSDAFGDGQFMEKPSCGLGDDGQFIPNARCVCPIFTHERQTRRI